MVGGCSGWIEERAAPRRTFPYHLVGARGRVVVCLGFVRGCCGLLMPDKGVGTAGVAAELFSSFLYYVKIYIYIIRIVVELINLHLFGYLMNMTKVQSRSNRVLISISRFQFCSHLWSFVKLLLQELHLHFLNSL